jgi:hypothetical protein
MPDNTDQHEDDDDLTYYIDGEPVTADDLTFKEQRTMRDIIRNLAPDNDPEQASDADILPALITVWKQRTDPKYRLDDALAMKQSDLRRPPTKAKTAKS